MHQWPPPPVPPRDLGIRKYFSESTWWIASQHSEIIYETVALPIQNWKDNEICDSPDARNLSVKATHSFEGKDFLDLVFFLEVRRVTNESRWSNLSGDIRRNLKNNIRLIKRYNHQIAEIVQLRRAFAMNTIRLSPVLTENGSLCHVNVTAAPSNQMCFCLSFLEYIFNPYFPFSNFFCRSFTSWSSSF